MKMFLGEFNPNLTDGSRIALPKKLRDQIRGNSVVMSRGFEKCIFLYDMEDWIEESKKQVENSIVDLKTRDLKRYMYASACEGTIDSQGRVVLNGSLLEYAGITKETAVIGAGDHIEIWDYSNWVKYLNEISANLARK